MIIFDRKTIFFMLLFSLKLNTFHISFASTLTPKKKVPLYPINSHRQALA